MDPRDSTSDELEQLSRNLRRLAEHLVRDPALAEDVVQEAWLAALNEPEERIRNIRAWLARVVRNLAARTRAREERRAEVEAWVGTPSGAQLGDACPREHESAAELCGPSGRLVELVKALPEPYGSVLQLRYLVGQAPSEIAARLQRRPATVKKQLQRGLAIVRDKLDHEEGRARWMALLAVPRRTVLERGAGAGAWGALWKAAALVLLLAGAGLVVSRSLRGAKGSEPAGLEGVALSRGAGDVAPARDELARAERLALPATDASASTPPPQRLELEVRRADGSPAPGAQVFVDGLDGTLFEGESGAAGRLVVELDPTLELVTVRARGQGEASSDHWSVPLPRDEVLSVPMNGPVTEVHGSITDAQGIGIAGAWIEVSWATAKGRTLPDGVTVAVLPYEATSGAGGEFHLADLPRGNLRVRVLASGYRALTRLLETPVRGDLRFVLEDGCAVAGTVTDEEGAPAAGARVWCVLGLGELTRETRTDAAGAYRLDGLPPGPHYLAVSGGGGPSAGAIERLELGERPTLEWSPSCGALPALRVRVLDAAGRPAHPAKILALGTLPDGRKWAQDRRSDLDGRATLTHLIPEPLSLVVVTPESSARMQPALEIPNVEVTPDELVVRLPVTPDAREWCSLRVQLLDAQGAPLATEVHAIQDDAPATAGPVSRFDASAPADGALHLGGLSVGRWRLAVMLGERGVWTLGPFDLSAGSELDLGALRCPPLRPLPSATRERISAAEGDVLLSWPELYDGYELATLAPGAASDMLPGRYRLDFQDGARHDFEVVELEGDE